MTHLFPKFLADESEYGKVEQFWRQIWADIPANDRAVGKWRADWFEPQPPRDGNPVFTAVSEKFRKGIRVIQYEPTSQEPELDFWLDTFGGEPTDPSAIRELVIACALSTESARHARKLMSSWILGAVDESDLDSIA